MKKIFVDSDILLDAIIVREPFYKSSANVLEACFNRYIVGYTSAIAFINTGYFLSKFVPERKLEALRSIRSIISIIEVNETIIDSALDSDFSDFEDAVQYFAAKSVNAEIIITRNIKDYKNSTIPVLTAEQFLRTL